MNNVVRIDRSGRAVIFAGVGSLMDTERDGTDEERIVYLGSRLGEVCDAWRYGNTDIDGELMLLAATALAMVEAHTEAAR